MRRFGMLLLWTLPLLAGCLSDSSGPDGTDTATADGSPVWAFLDPVDLVCPDTPVAPVLDVMGDCGAFGEPVIEVAGDGTVWASATCCIGRSPVIWVSRDGGASFEALPFADGTGVVRDATGIEGDFAIDDAGNVYFFDILAATAYLTKYEADGTHVHTKPDPFPPLVDRPWVRAGIADQVWAFYNTGSATALYTSTDGGWTWDLAGGTTFPCSLMIIGQGPDRQRLFVTGCPDDPRIWFSTDGGATWAEPLDLPAPSGLDIVDPYFPSAADAAGNVYVTFAAGNDTDQRVFMDIVRPDGSMVGPLDLSGPGWHDLPWPAAGEEGRVAVAWYGTTGTPDDPSKPWYLHAAVSTDAADGTPTFHVTYADPDPVLPGGPLERNLGDFLEADVGPDGRFYIAYAADEGGLQNKVVISDGAVDLGRGVPYNG